MLRFFLLVMFLCCSELAQAIWFDIPSSGTKCVSEDISKDVVVLAHYSLINYDDDSANFGAHLSVWVTSPSGNTLHHEENKTHGQFAFTTAEAGKYLACFWVDSDHQMGSGLTISLDWRIGIAAKDWESVARKEKIEGVELELRKLGDIVESIHWNLNLLKNKEAEMREVSEKTNARVAWFSIMSLGLCVGVSVLQLWYLQRYFHKKKLI